MKRITKQKPDGLSVKVTRQPPKIVLLGSVGLAWLTAITQTSMFWLVGYFLDQRLNGVTDMAVCGWLLAGGIITALVTYWSIQFSTRSTMKVEKSFRHQGLRQVFDLGVTKTQNKSGQLLSTLTTAVENASHYRAGFIGPIIGSMTVPLVVLALMALLINPAIAGWLTLLVATVPVLVGGFQRLVSPIGAAYRNSRNKLTAGFLEAIQGVDTLVFSRAEQRMAQELVKKGETHRKQLMKMLAGNQLMIFVVDAGFSLAVIIAATQMCINRLQTGEISLGQSVSILLMTLLVISPVNQIGQFFYIGIGGRAGQRQISELLSTEIPATAETDSTGLVRTDKPATEYAIEFSHVSAGWPECPNIIENFSFSVNWGETVALVGPSGVGKSTISALIQAHLTPREGQVKVCGMKVGQHPSDQIRKQLAVVEQRTFLFLGSIKTNLLLANPTASEEQLWAALKLAGLSEEVKRMPNQLDTPVGEHGTLLSGGQTQRLAIARATLTQAPILLLDEPTSEVDLAGEEEILAAIRRLSVGKTVLMIAHRPNAIMAADRVIQLSIKQDVSGRKPL